MPTYRTYTTKSLKEEVSATSVGAGVSQAITNKDGSPAEPPANQKAPTKPQSLAKVATWLKRIKKS